MSSLDDPDGVDPDIPQSRWQGLEGNPSSLLLEGLMYALIEKGVLTKNDAMGVVQTAAEVIRGADDGSKKNAQIAAELEYLRRVFISFAALDDEPQARRLNGANVHQLRPPVHGDHPQFPDDD